MLNLLFICILVSIFSLSKTIELERPKLTRTIKIREYLSANVPVKSDLYTIFYNTSHIRIKSTDKDYKSCVLPTDAFSNNHQIYAKPLGSKLRFVVWSIYRSEIYNKTIDVQTTMFLIDPWHCKSKNILLPMDHQPRWYRRINLDQFDYPHALQVVTHAHSFDVFFGGSNICSPCRFDIDGEEIKMQFQVDPDSFDAMEASYLQTIKLFNATRKYFQVYRFTDFTTEIKLLDVNFMLLKAVNLRHMVSLIDVDRDVSCLEECEDQPTIVICYLSRYAEQSKGAEQSESRVKYIYCKKYDAELDRKYSVRLPMAVEAYPSSFSLTLDSIGQAFVTYEAPYGNTTKLAVFQYDVDGNLVKSLDFSDSNGMKKVVQGSLFMGADYCLVSWVKRNGRDSCNKIIECTSM